MDGCADKLRRRSVDVGGLALALNEPGSGGGWGGWEEHEVDQDGEARYAELLSDMYTQTQTTVYQHGDLAPIEVRPEMRRNLIAVLDSWEFEPHKLSDDALLVCTFLLFETLFRIDGMARDVGFSLERLSPFLRTLRQIYRQQNSYHNYQHALDVLQATHMFLRSAGVAPPATILAGDGVWIPRIGSRKLIHNLTNTDLFALYVAAIGHDVGHPGFTNVFMKNAKTPLSVVYDDKSPLEQMHCALLLQVMRTHGLGVLLDRPGQGPRVREILSRTVLATDMNVHFQFMKDFASLLENGHSNPDAGRIAICQALIKCADISNPGRPPSVSQYWANALMTEWTNQAALERHLHLPPTVQPSQDPLSEAKSQVFFITTFAKPLFDLTTKAIPEMKPYAEQCTFNLENWKKRLAELTSTPSSSGGGKVPPAIATGLPIEVSDNYLGAFPLTLPPHLVVPEALTPLTSPTPSMETGSAAGRSSTPRTAPAPAPSIPVLPPSPTMPGAYMPTPPLRPVSAPSTPPLSPVRSLFSPSSQSGSLPSPSVHARTLSIVSTASGASVASAAGASSAAQSIRTAYKLSVRKKKSFHGHRSSWNPTPVPPVPSLPRPAATAATPAPSAP